MEIKQMKIADMSDKQKMIITKEKLLEFATEYACNAVYEFIKECGEMAETHLCEWECKDINRLFNSVLNGEPYAPEPEEE